MKTSKLSKCVAAAILIVSLETAHSQQADATKEIENAIGEYLKAMSARDVKGLQAVLDKRFVAVEASDKNARLHFIDTGNTKELMPPEGNDDWNKDKIKLSSVKAEISPSHPSVAMASFTLTFPLNDQRVANLEAALKQHPADFDESQRQAITRMISQRAIHNSMFAMFARHDGNWKIVCMSFPK